MSTLVGRSPHPIVIDGDLLCPLDTVLLSRRVILLTTEKDLPAELCQWYRKLWSTSQSMTELVNAYTTGAEDLQHRDEQHAHNVSQKYELLKALEKNGAIVLPIPSPVDVSSSSSTSSSRVDLRQSLELLKRHFHSIMVEGGARVISTFLSSMNEENTDPLMNQVIVTIAPLFVDGYKPKFTKEQHHSNLSIAKLTEVVWEPCGKDMLLMGQTK